MAHALCDENILNLLGDSIRDFETWQRDCDRVLNPVSRIRPLKDDMVARVVFAFLQVRLAVIERAILPLQLTHTSPHTRT